VFLVLHSVCGLAKKASERKAEVYEEAKKLNEDSGTVTNMVTIPIFHHAD
jgi:hypothetical protein